jgi:S1-C subfamily serine protease
MKTFSTNLLLLFFVCCSIPFSILAQSSDNQTSEKKIVITKRSVDAEGSEVIETIIKKGKAAEQFDVDKYVRENTKDDVTVDVRVVQNGTQDQIEVYGLNDNDNEDEQFDMDGDERGFLGVQIDSDEDNNMPGLQVEVIKCSAAAKAGLKTNDVILFLNGKQVNSWSDLTQMIRKAKPGDSLDIRYSRDGKEAFTTATLTTRDAADCNEKAEKKGFLGVQPGSSRSKTDDPGTYVNIVKNSAAEQAGLKNGDRIEKMNDTAINDWEDIQDFMDETQPRDKVTIVYSRNKQRLIADAVIGTQKDWDWDNWNTQNWDWKGLDVEVKDKEACLGVYTEAYAQDNAKGAKIQSFTDESAASEAKMEEGDVITAVNGKTVASHDDLWNAISQYKPGEKVKVEFLRADKNLSIDATLKACKDNSNKIILNETNGKGDNQNRQFFIWNWGTNEQNRIREHHVITIHKGEGDGEKVNATPNNNVATDRALKLDAFKVYPNPTQGQVTVEFKASAVPTIVALFDASGRQLFREELNSFNGDYMQQFDLNEYAKGNILVQVLQGNKVFSEQIIVN